MKGTITFEIGKDDPQQLDAIATALGAKPLVKVGPTVPDLAGFAAVCKHLAAGQKINAIREARALWGLSLKEAKDLVEGCAPSTGGF